MSVAPSCIDVIKSLLLSFGHSKRRWVVLQEHHHLTGNLWGTSVFLPAILL